MGMTTHEDNTGERKEGGLDKEKAARLVELMDKFDGGRSFSRTKNHLDIPIGLLKERLDYEEPIARRKRDEITVAHADRPDSPDSDRRRELDRQGTDAYKYLITIRGLRDLLHEAAPDDDEKYADFHRRMKELSGKGA